MPYALTTSDILESPIQIDGSRYRLLAEADAIQHAVLRAEEKFDLVITNYEELESSLITLTTRHMIRRDLPWRRMSADRLLLNRRIANLLTTCRLYTDQVRHDVASPFKLDLAAISKLFSAQYDQSLGYRVMESLRNQLQHHSIPITGIRYGSVRDGDRAGFRIDLGLDLEMLQEGGFKASVLHELRALAAPQLDIILFVREYVQGLATAHAVIRDLVKADVIRADAAFAGARDEWVTSGRKYFPLRAVEVRDDGGHYGEIIVGTNIQERRDELATANQSLLSLSRRFVTSARPAEAYR
jgi:hypothetical protein